MINAFIEYLEKEKKKNINALSLIDHKHQIIPGNHIDIKAPEIGKMKLNDRVFELTKHIETIKRMYPKG